MGRKEFLKLITAFILVLTIVVGITGCSASDGEPSSTNAQNELTNVEAEKPIEKSDSPADKALDDNAASVEDVILNGDFSDFAGDYIATLEDHDAYGGGEKLSSLTLNADGSICGGASYYSEGFYSIAKPVSIEKNEDGFYMCKITEDCYYTLYPIGVIEDDEYVIEYQSYLKDTVYINCIVIDGGILDITYYLEKDEKSKESLIENYAGVDWVSMEDFQDEIGGSFVSGTGIEYTVIGEDIDNDSGRISIIIESAGGQKRIIANIPAFKMDEKTGILYYDIYEYAEN